MEDRRVMALGSGVAVEMRVSERARRWRVQVGAGGVVVVRPRRMSEREALRLLDAHGAWVAAQVDRLHALRRATAMPPGTVRFQGHPVPVRRVPTPAGTRARVEPAGGELLVHLPGSDDDRVAAVLEAWLRDQARQAIGASVALHAARMQVKPARIGIRSQRTRWGSCSRNGGLSFNWRLIQVPQEVLDYVVVHELAHIVHPNHSPDFWMLVQRHCPAYPAHKRWLRRHAGTMEGPPDPDDSPVQFGRGREAPAAFPRSAARASDAGDLTPASGARIRRSRCAGVWLKRFLKIERPTLIFHA